MVTLSWEKPSDLLLQVQLLAVLFPPAIPQLLSFHILPQYNASRKVKYIVWVLSRNLSDAIFSAGFSASADVMEAAEGKLYGIGVLFVELLNSPPLHTTFPVSRETLESVSLWTRFSGFTFLTISSFGFSRS